MTWKLYESMNEAKAEALAEACEDTPVEELCINTNKEWQERWVGFYTAELEEWNAYLDSIEGAAHA